jgi:hypothetical protein
LFTVWSESLDDAKTQFYCSSQFNSFEEKHRGLYIYTFLIDKYGDFLNV